jgi:hypothetical protein
MHYKVETYTLADGWLPSAAEYKLLVHARLQAALVRERGGMPRIILVIRDGLQKAMEDI